MFQPYFLLKKCKMKEISLHKYEIKKGGHGPFYFFTWIIMVVMATKCLKLGKSVNTFFSETTVPISPKFHINVLWMVLGKNPSYTCCFLWTLCVVRITKYLKVAETVFTKYFPSCRLLVAMPTRTINRSLQYIGIWKRTTKGTFLRSKVEIGSVFSEDKVCKDL